jgi:hypothetical protein
MPKAAALFTRILTSIFPCILFLVPPTHHNELGKKSGPFSGPLWLVVLRVSREGLGGRHVA